MSTAPPQIPGAEMAGAAPRDNVRDVAAPEGTPNANQLDKLAIVGAISWLMMSTPTHKHVFVSDLEWSVMPPVALGQFFLWRRQGVPVGYATWAYLNQEAEERVRSGSLRLAPKDWKSGDRLWLIDFVVPFGGQQEALVELKTKILAGKKVNAVQRAPDGGLAFMQW